MPIPNRLNGKRPLVAALTALIYTSPGPPRQGGTVLVREARSEKPSGAKASSGFWLLLTRDFGQRIERRLHLL